MMLQNRSHQSLNNSLGERLAGIGAKWLGVCVLSGVLLSACGGGKNISKSSSTNVEPQSAMKKRSLNIKIFDLDGKISDTMRAHTVKIVNEKYSGKNSQVEIYFADNVMEGINRSFPHLMKAPEFQAIIAKDLVRKGDSFDGYSFFVHNPSAEIIFIRASLSNLEMIEVLEHEVAHTNKGARVRESAITGSK